MLPNLGSSQQEAAVIVGFFLPLVLAVPIQSSWPDWAKSLFSVGCYAAAGAIVALAAGTLTGQTFWEATLTVLTLGVVGYQGVWKPTNIAPRLQQATDVGRAPQLDKSQAETLATRLSDVEARIEKIAAAGGPDAKGDASAPVQPLADRLDAVVAALEKLASTDLPNAVKGLSVAGSATQRANGEPPAPAEATTQLPPYIK